MRPGDRVRGSDVVRSMTVTAPLLVALLRQMGIEPSRIRHVKDHPTALFNATDAALRRADVLVVAGGVSVGEKDYLRDVLRRLRVREAFWRVAQKPGKPLYFGTRGRKLVFGLPGNPASAFTCFYVYVYDALRRLSGFREGSLPVNAFRQPSDLSADPKKWRFLKAVSSGSGVAELPHQGSHMVTTLPRADHLLIVPPRGDEQSGGNVLAYRLPYAENSND